MENEILKIDEGIFQCVDCGAYAKSKEQIKHYITCSPGEAKRWEEYFSKEENNA
jgi:hypothetical protein